MHVYLYLNEISHAETWVNGGFIPINPASVYKSDSRFGVYTPDENLIHKGELNLLTLAPGLFIDPAGHVENLNINANVDGRRVIITSGDYYSENGLVLSFSNTLSRSVLERFIGKKTCVKINNIERLKKILDKRLGCKSISGCCKYTETHERNHFLKSNLDSWQDEFRLFWKCEPKTRWVEIPSGLAEVVSIPSL